MNRELQTEIRNVRKFGVYGRVFCVLLAVGLALRGFGMFVSILGGPTSYFRVDLGAFSIWGDQLTTTAAKAWASIVVSAVWAIFGAVLFHLFRLFNNLVTAEIYTRENVRHLRRVGVLVLAGSVLQIVVFAISTVLLQTRVIDPALVTVGNAGLGPYSFSSFLTAAVLLLASWIMDIGRQTTDDADALRREAELVI